MATYNYQGCWNDTGNRAIPWYVGNMSPEQCQEIAQLTGNSVYGLQYYGQCFVGNDLSQAQEYGPAYGGDSSACGPQGNSWTNQVYAALPYTMPNYQMSPAELTCYQQNNPDLAGMTPQQLQEHWTMYGAYEQRNNQCPPFQTQSGLYNYIGTFNDTGNRAIPNFRGNVSSIDECQTIANDTGETLFGVQYYGQCFTGTNLAQAQEYGRNVNRNEIGPMGTAWTNQIYVRSQPFPPPPPPLPSLQNQNFSSTTN
jgi:hypothetical protein